MIALVTERLRLRTFTEHDLPFLLEVHRHPALAQFIPGAVCENLADARARLERFSVDVDHPVLGFPCIETHDGTPVGMLMLKPIPPSGRGLAPTAVPGPGEEWDIEIGWRGHPAHGGHGYIAEAARAALAHAFEYPFARPCERGLRRVVAVTHPDNHASQRVAELAGMRRIGLTSAWYDTTTLAFEATAPG